MSNVVENQHSKIIGFDSHSAIRYFYVMTAVYKRALIEHKNRYTIFIGYIIYWPAMINARIKPNFRHDSLAPHYFPLQKALCMRLETKFKALY